MLKKYTDEINTLVLISLLKQHGIKKIIASPGTTNISFIASIQQDEWFEIYSAVDERSAAYIANGFAEESGEIVVLSCTGATASRNYLPGLTEAYYRHLPIIAITSTQNVGKVGQYASQVIDRSAQFPDLVKMSVQLPTVYTKIDENITVRKVNEAILETVHGERGPVHINLATVYSNNFTVEKLPEYRKIDRILKTDVFPSLPKGKIGIYIWSHLPFTDKETNAIDNFCKSYNAVVICDLVSNYHGDFRFLATLSNCQEPNMGAKKFDLLINIGNVHGNSIPVWAKEQWRVNPDGVIRDRDNDLTKIFEMDEIDFFSHYYVVDAFDTSHYDLCVKEDKLLRSRIPELPFSNMWIASVTSACLPKNSILHLGILNSLRCWNYFEVDGTINCFTNSGGYGIDGCLSSFIGASYKHIGNECYLILGDLSFFYDVNSVLNKIPSNAHIMVINNGIGTEFKNYNHRAAQFKESADAFMAAKGHNGYKSKVVLKNICSENNIRYLSASSKSEFEKVKNSWLSKGDSPVIIEVFTTDKDESDAIRLMNSLVKDTSIKGLIKRTSIGKFAKRLLKEGK